MKCPVCHIPLVVVEREGIEIDWCLECRGLWFDEGELELLAEKSGRRVEPFEERGTKGQRKCPRCSRKMSELPVGAGESPRIDRCADHGIWFDRGELGDVLRRAASEAASGSLLQFLGETFGGEAPAGASHPEGRQT